MRRITRIQTGIGLCLPLGRGTTRTEVKLMEREEWNAKVVGQF